MKQIATSYSVSGNQVTLTGVNVPLSQVTLISDVSTGTVLYSVAGPAATSYVQGTNSVITLATAPGSNDGLYIAYDDGVKTTNAPTTVTANVTFPATQNVSLVSSSDATAIPVTASSLPLPTGAATATNQATEINYLNTIAGNTNSGSAITGQNLGSGSGVLGWLSSIYKQLTSTLVSQISDGVNTSNKVTVSAFHNQDNTTTGTGYGILTGGVAQVLNPAGTIDRQRSTGFDNIPSRGVATGSQQLASALMSTTVTSGAINGNNLPQNVTLAALSFTFRGATGTIQPGSILLVDGGNTNQEYVYVNSVNTVTNSVNGIFYNNHAANVTVSTYSYNQAKDATLTDGSTTAGVPAGVMFFWNASLNNGVGGLEMERSFSGELTGATGQGAACAVVYEDASGGPVLATGIPSGKRLFQGQSMVGKGYASAPITASVAGNTSLVFSSASAAQTIPAGHAIRLTGGATAETVFSSSTWVPGSSATVPLQSAVVNAGQTTASWDIYSANGPGISGFLPHGIGIEEEAIFDPVTNLYYIERSATQDGVSSQNIVLESPGLWNGSSMDRAREVIGDAQSATGLPAEVPMLFNGTTYDRARSGQTAPIAATGLQNEITMSVYNSTAPTATSGQAVPLQGDSAGRLLVKDHNAAASGSAFLTGTGSATGNFYAVQVLTNTIFATLTDSTRTGSTMTGVTIPAGTTFFGNITSIALTSGTIIAYNA